MAEGSDEVEIEETNSGSGCWPKKKISEEVVSLLIPIGDEWEEIEYINSYAVLMGYLSMALRGLAFLVVTWTTVILLGGFVSVLGKKDFWCLTVITLAQTVGVFDVFLNEKLSNIWFAYKGLFSTTVCSTLAELSLKSKITATIILSANDDVTSDLSAILLDVARNNSCRKSAAEILKHLCSHYTKDEECFDRLKKALTDAMPKVLTELLRYGLTVEIETGNKANNNGFSAPDIDIETGRAAQDSTSKDISSPGELKCNQEKDRKLKEALLSLCLMVSETLTTEDPDLARQLDEIAASVCFDAVIPVMTFASIMKEAQELLNEKKQAQDSEIVPAS